MKRLFLIVVAFVFACTSSVMAQKLDSKIGNDPNVKIGKLENGMTYYIRQNAKPEGRVEFRLAVNAGSNQEDDDQQGLAHFTEHMAFNGIEGYPHNTMIKNVIRGNAGLAGVEGLAPGYAAGCKFDVCSAVNDAGALASKFQNHGSKMLCGSGHYLAAQSGATGKEYHVKAAVEQHFVYITVSLNHCNVVFRERGTDQFLQYR